MREDEKIFLIVLGVFIVVFGVMVLILGMTNAYNLESITETIITAVFAGIVVAILIEGVPIIIRHYKSSS